MNLKLQPLFRNFIFIENYHHSPLLFSTSMENHHISPPPLSIP